jgi:hypothetical protein
VHRAAAVWGLPKFDDLREKLFKFALATGNISFANILNDVLNMHYQDVITDTVSLAWVLGDPVKSSYSQYLINCEFRLPLTGILDRLYVKDKKSDYFIPWEIPQDKE